MAVEWKPIPKPPLNENEGQGLARQICLYGTAATCFVCFVVSCYWSLGTLRNLQTGVTIEWTLKLFYKLISSWSVYMHSTVMLNGIVVCTCCLSLLYDVADMAVRFRVFRARHDSAWRKQVTSSLRHFHCIQTWRHQSAANGSGLLHQLRVSCRHCSS